MAKVVVLKVYKRGELVAEKQLNQDHIVLGSSESEAHVTLPGDASPIHASIEKRNEKYVLCDLGSEKGTFKNDDKILEAEIKPGDKIVAGEFTIEFYLQEVPDSVASTMSAKQENAPVDEEITVSKNLDPQPTQSHSQTYVEPVAAAAVGGGLSSVVSKKTYAPASVHKNVNEFIRPTKGTLIEVLVAWRERVISAYHFSNKGTVTIGTHPSCDVIVPIISTSVNKVPLIQLSQQAQIILHPGMDGTLISDRQTISFNQLTNIGRGSGGLTLQQGEMARIQLGGDVEVIVRYASQAPKPVVVPFIDLSSNGFLAVLLAIVLTGILSLYVALNKLDKIDKPEDEQFRTALIITNPPKPPPQPKIKLPPPEKEKKKVEPIVKKEPPKKKKVVKIDMEKKKPRVRVAPEKKKPGGGAGGQRARGSGKDSDPRAMRPKEGKKTNQVTSVKQGGAVKTANKEGAQMQSERKLKNSGIFSAFGSGGRNNRIDNSYSGSGELSGLADQATGTAGSSEDRPGDGLGSKFKDTGAGGNGKSNVGVSGLSKGGKGLGAGGFGDGGLGDRKAVSIIPGGGGEEFSGQIDREGIRKVFFDNQRAIRSCYERELNRDPNLSGKIMLNFDIGEHGRVVGTPSVNWGDSTLQNRGVAECVLGRLRTWRFPEPPRNQVVNVIYPLAFAAK